MILKTAASDQWLVKEIQRVMGYDPFALSARRL